MSLPVFETLSTHHDRQGFDCGVEPLNDFLKRQARQNAERDVGVTHVVVPVTGDSKILAYYTLRTRDVDSAVIPAKKLPRGAIGTVLLGRLAVDKTAQRQGLGKRCLLRAMEKVEIAAREIGIYALAVDALDDAAREWYIGLNYGFQALGDDPNHLFLPVATIRLLLVPQGD